METGKYVGNGPTSSSEVRITAFHPVTDLDAAIRPRNGWDDYP
jgi:hypothetical protein